jgi:hypothetical protein
MEYRMMLATLPNQVNDTGQKSYTPILIVAASASQAVCLALLGSFRRIPIIGHGESVC